MLDKTIALPEFEDPRVKVVYEILCDTSIVPPTEEHWEGFLARHIVAALHFPSPAGVTEAAVEAIPITGPAQQHRASAEELSEAMAKSMAAFAAIPLLSPSMGWEIKKLEWEDKGNGLLKAHGPFGLAYFVNTRTQMWLGLDDDWAVADDAKAAAQADYEQRIRSALLPPANGEGR